MILPAEGFLLCLSQIGLGFAGFTAIIMTLRQENAWRAGEVAAISFILEHSLGTTLFSIIPVILIYFGMSEPAVWKAACSVMGVFLGSLLLGQMRRIRRVPPARPTALFAFYLLPTPIVIAMLGLSGIWAVRPGVYCSSLIYLLIQASIQFWIAFVAYTSDKEQPSGVGRVSRPDED